MFICKNVLDNDFAIKIHWPMIYIKKNSLAHDLYYKNGLEMIFTIKMDWKWFLL